MRLPTILIWKSPTLAPRNTISEFIADIEAAVASKPDVLVCTLTEPDAMDEVLRTAIADGLPVIAINALTYANHRKTGSVLTYGRRFLPYRSGSSEETLKRFTPSEH